MIKLDMESLAAIVQYVKLPHERLLRQDTIQQLEQLIAEVERGLLAADLELMYVWLKELQFYEAALLPRPPAFLAAG